jgi:hypothetical protein
MKMANEIAAIACDVEPLRFRDYLLFTAPWGNALHVLD